MIKIYEFSTNIDASYSGNLKQWVSHRYNPSHPYMCSTFQKDPTIQSELGSHGIPKIIHKAIQNNLFEIKFSGELYSQNAIAGRYLDDNRWAVIAIVSYIGEAHESELNYITSKSQLRPSPVYRFFCGLDESGQDNNLMNTLILWYYDKDSPFFSADPNDIRYFETTEPNYKKFLPTDNSVAKECLQEIKNHQEKYWIHIQFDYLFDVEYIISQLSEQERLNFSWAVGVTNGQNYQDKFNLVYDNYRQLWLSRPKLYHTLSTNDQVNKQELKRYLEQLAKESLKDKQTSELLTQLFNSNLSSEIWADFFEREHPSLSERMETQPSEVFLSRLFFLRSLLIPKKLKALIPYKNSFIGQLFALILEREKVKKSDYIKEFEKQILKIMLKSYEKKYESYEQQEKNSNSHSNVTLVTKNLSFPTDKISEKLCEGVWYVLESIVKEKLEENLPTQKSQSRFNGLFNHANNNDLEKLTLNGGLWDFALRYLVVLDFLNHIHKNHQFISPNAQKFFQKLESRPKSQQKKAYLCLQEIWQPIDPVITAFFCQKAEQEIPFKLWQEIEHSNIWKPYINKLDLAPPSGTNRFLPSLQNFRLF